jgi:two-component system, OmpR family, response regulator
VSDLSGQKGRILVVDDDEATAALASTALRWSGFLVDLVHDGAACLRKLQDLKPDLVILDAVLSGMDGFQLVERLRAGGDSTPVMFLSGRHSVHDRVRGLRLGADDYLSKPFDLEEFVLRVEAILRRGRDPVPADGMVLRYADLELDGGTHEVRRSRRVVHLSPTEFRMLEYLLVNAQKVVSKAQIFEQVWGYSYCGNSQIIESYVHLLRKKVDFVEPKLIHTVRGFGYALRFPQAEPEPIR